MSHIDIKTQRMFQRYFLK